MLYVEWVCPGQQLDKLTDTLENKCVYIAVDNGSFAGPSG